jgi:predicted nucleic acid-binding protein
MRWAILDSNVYIDHWQGRLADGALEPVRARFVIRQSAVVLSELRRGARTSKARRIVEALRRVSPIVWEPTGEDWWTAAAWIRKIGDAHDWDASRRRDFQNDVLIALTARRHGATVVTTNRSDFELLARPLGIAVLIP